MNASISVNNCTYFVQSTDICTSVEMQNLISLLHTLIFVMAIKFRILPHISPLNVLLYISLFSLNFSRFLHFISTFCLFNLMVTFDSVTTTIRLIVLTFDSILFQTDTWLDDTTQTANRNQNISQTEIQSPEDRFYISLLNQ